MPEAGELDDPRLMNYTILHEDDDVYQEICSQDHAYYPEYEYDDRD